MSTAATQDPPDTVPGRSLFSLRECEISQAAGAAARCPPRRRRPGMVTQGPLSSLGSRLRLIRFNLRRCAQGLGPLFAGPPHPAGLFVQVHLGLRMTRLGADDRARRGLERRGLRTPEGQADFTARPRGSPTPTPPLNRHPPPPPSTPPPP